MWFRLKLEIEIAFVKLFAKDQGSQAETPKTENNETYNNP